MYVRAEFYQAALKSRSEQASRPWNRSRAVGQSTRPPITEDLKYNSGAPAVMSAGSLILTALRLPIPQAQDTSIRKIEIPSIGLSAMVLEGEDEETLRLGVGHISGTAVPGSSGNVGLAGHRDTFFRRLERIRIGDVIWISMDGSTFQYRVASTAVVHPSDVQVLDDTQRPTLTLITCYPFHYVGAAPERFIVHAELTSSPLKR